MDKNILCIIVVETFKAFPRNQYISPKRFLNYEFFNSDKFFFSFVIIKNKLCKVITDVNE